MIAVSKKAPVSKTQREQLRKDLSNLAATAQRKGTTLDAYEASREGRVGKEHFELGCWLYRFNHLRGLTAEQDLKERIEIVARLFLAGIQNPRYDFFTAFDFGERQFDSIFEQGDAMEVIDGLRDLIPQDKTGKIAEAFGAYGWPMEKPVNTERPSA